MESNTQSQVTETIRTDDYYEALSPVAVNYLAAINGFRTRDLGDFDYCELGCGRGLSLLVHAATHPGGRFVGIDFDAERIRRIERLAAAAGISNLRLIVAPEGDLPVEVDLPAFDFITLNGLYTRVSEGARSRILDFVRGRLAAGGMVLVSYDALPGCAGREGLRAAMRRFAMPLSPNALERAELGLSYVRLMLNAQAPLFRHNPQLAAYGESLFSRDLCQLANEFFGDDWHPLSVDQVARELSGAGMEFAGCLPLWHNDAEADVPANLAAFFADLPNRLDREANKDFIYDTATRTDLYVRAQDDGAHRIDRSKALWDMPFASVAAPDAVRFSVTSGALSLTLNTRESRSLYGLLQDRTLSPAELAETPALASVEPDRIVDTLCRWVLSGQVRPAATMDEGSRACSARLNAALLADAFRSGIGGQICLASPRFGIAFPFDKLPALAVCAIAGAAGAPPEDEFCALMQRCGLAVEENGSAMTAGELRALADQLYGELEAHGVLDHAMRLGISG